MTKQPQSLALLALLALVVVFDTAVAMPTASFGNSDNRPTVLKNIGFNLILDLSYPADSDGLQTARAVYAQAWWNGKMIGESNIPIAAGEPLPSTMALSGLVVTEAGNQPINVFLSYTSDFSNTSEQEYLAWVICGGVSIIPPLLVIVVAVITREVLLALFVGIFAAATIVAQGNVLSGFLSTMSTYMVDSLGNVDHAFVILFSWFLAGMVAVVQKSGGGHGIANVIMERITSRRGLMMSVFFLGFVIFFDDYANTLILGSTMRPLSDAFLVSREKLAFIVDATTAPIASIAPISSWIGYEVGLINEQLEALVGMGYGAELEEAGLTSGYTIFLESILSRYYPIYMLMFQFMLIALKRDMGPMLKAERRAIDKKQVSDPSANEAEVELDNSLEPADNIPRLWWNSVIPILVTLVAVFAALLITGYNGTVSDGSDVNAANLFGNGDSYSSLLWGSFIGSVSAWFLIRAQYHYKGKPYNAWKHFIRFQRLPVDEDGDYPRPILTFKESLETWIEGIKGLTTPVLVLIMAWGIGAAVQDVSCDLFFANGLSSDSMDPRMLPTLTFLISAVISFCTGTSWGTMSIMFPLSVPAAWISSRDREIFVMTIAGVLAGAVFGDHATAISDTTILSSLATKCDLRHHVITQLPYACIVAVFSVLLGTIPAAYAYPAWAGLLIGLGAMMVLPLLIAERIDHPARRMDPFSRLVEFARVVIFKREPTEVFIPKDVEHESLTYKDIWMAFGAKAPRVPTHRFSSSSEESMASSDALDGGVASTSIKLGDGVSMVI